MLTSTEVIRHIEMYLGYKFSQLEVSQEEILDIIRMETLPTFSKYFPYPVNTSVDTSLDLVPNSTNTFYLHSETEIINVNRVITNTLLNQYTSVDCVATQVSPAYYTDPISRQLDRDLYSAVKNPITFRFIAPNKVEITPRSVVGLGQLMIQINTVHPDHFGTIPLNMREYFLKLALYDVEIMLYHIRRRFQSLQTTFGEMELFVDELAEAEDKKKELLEEKFLVNSIKSSSRKKLIIA